VTLVLVLVLGLLGWLEVARLGLAWHRAASRKAHAAAIHARVADLAAPDEPRSVGAVPMWRLLLAIAMPPLVVAVVATEIVSAAHASMVSFGPLAVLPLLALPLVASLGHQVARQRWGPPTR
jgi:hypothetical protein